MPTGRKPKPTRLHLVEGTFDVSRHRKRLKGEPRPIGDLHDPPAYLSQAQREIWAQQLRDAPAGLLKRLDWSDFLVWVVACDIHRQAAEQLNKLGPQGLIICTGTKPGPGGTQLGGTFMQNPLVGIMNRQALIMMKASEVLGFSPVARARVSVDPTTEVNPFDEFG